MVRTGPYEQVRAQRAILTVILVHRDEGGYWGANGWESSPADRRRYGKGEWQVMSADKDARGLVEAAQEESEAAFGEELPEEARGERRGRSVVQSVRLPVEDFEEIERIAARAKVPVGALIRGWVLGGLAAERGTSLRDAIDHLAEEAQRLRRLAAVSDVA